MKEKIYKYISDNDGRFDSVDIVSKFKLRVDIAMDYLDQLQEENKIERRCLGVRYRYFVIN